MKKSFFRVFFMLCMLFVLVPVVTGTVLADDVHKHPVCVDKETCTDPDHKSNNNHGDEITWIGVSSLPKTEGYYYLTDDVTISGTWYPASGTVLCLNGHNIKMSAHGNCIGVTGNFILTDCNTINKQYGQWNDEKTTYSISKGKPTSEPYDTLNGGVIYSSCSSNQHSLWGCAGVQVGDGGTFSMYGGTIAGHLTSGVTFYNNHGIYNKGTFNLYNGTIIGNRNSAGGGVYTYYEHSATFNMYGGTIKNNYTTNDSGGVYIGGRCTFDMYGGTITGNQAARDGGGVKVDGTLKVSGTAIITGNTIGESTTSNVYLSSGKTITVAGKLDSSAKIGVTMQTPGTFTSGWSTNGSGVDSSVFSSDNETYKVGTRSGELELVGPHEHNLGTEKVTFDKIWTTTNSLPTTAGSYVLACDVTLDTTWQVNADIALDLNGHDITFSGTSGSVIKVNSGTFTLYDCGTETRYGYWDAGKTSYTVTDTQPDSVTTDYTTLTGGVITGGNNNGVYVLGTFQMYGGTIAGNTASFNCGGVYVQGTFTMNGGTIAGNTASFNCGGVYVQGTFTMNGGTIQNNTAGTSGGGVFVVQNYSFTMNGGTIQNNRAGTYGGGVYVDGSFTMNGGTIQSNSANTAGGVYVQKTFQVSGTAKITGNTKTGGTTSNVYLLSNRTITIAGALDSSAKIGVTMANSTVAFTSGWKTNMSTTAVPSDYFTSDNSSYAVYKTNDEELALHTHNWGTAEVTKQATCVAAGTKKYTCSVCGATKEEEITQLSHNYTYAVDENNGNVIVETCDKGCNHSVKATISVKNNASLVYTGSAIEAAEVTYDPATGWQGGTLKISYTNNINVGTATAKISKNNTVGDAAEASVTYNITNANITTGTLTVSMSGYTYGDTVSTPSISGTYSGNGTVTYYYSNTNSTQGGTDFSGVSSTTLRAGTYYMYATIAATDNYNGYTTGTTSFTIGNASQAAPAASVVSIDYETETLSFDDNIYEVNTAEDFNANTVANGNKVIPGNTYYVRLKAKANYNASQATTVTIPARATAPDASASNETIKGKNDGKITGVDSTMEYKLSTDNTWTAISGDTVTNLASGTYYVRYKATDSAFYSQAATVVVAEGSTLTVTFNSNGSTIASKPNLSYNQAVDALPTTSCTGYTFEGWYKGETKLTEATQITENVTYTAKWTLKAPTVTAGENYSATYDGKEHTISVTASHAAENGITLSYQWYKGGTEAEYKLENKTGSTLSVTDVADSGTYYCVVTASDGTQSQSATTGAISVTISKAALTVTAVDKTATYGDAKPTYTVSYSAFQGTDSDQSLSGTLSISCDYAQYSAKGDYTITPSGLTSSNYDITFTAGKLTVSPKEITVTIASKSSAYGAELAALTATDEGIVNNDTNVYRLATTATKTSNVGSYDITGTVNNTNYSVTFTGGTEAYTIVNASQTAPAEGVGYTIDYAKETITVDTGYEVSTTENLADGTAVTSGSKVTPGNTYYVRLAAKDNYNASGWTEFTVARRPAKPDGLTPTAETAKAQGDGRISGVDSTMEYKLSTDEDWRDIDEDTTMLTNLAAGTYDIRYKVVTTAGKEAFVSEATQVKVAVGDTLTVSFESNGGSEAREIPDLSYNQAVGALPTTSRTGYTFEGWYNDDTKLETTTPITENVTYTAKWTLNNSTIVGTGYSGTYDEKAHSISVAASHVLTSGLTYSYQWQKLTDATWTDISGATESSYDLTYAAESGSYRCVVTASDGTLTSVTYSDKITVTIEAQETELPENSGAVIKDSEQAKITIDGVSEVPETLVRAGLSTVEEVQEKLEQVLQEQTQTNVTGSESSENQAIYEVALMVSKDSGKTWSLATKENFPADGKLTVVLPYPEGTDSSYVFTAVHMFTTDYFGNTPGDTEVLTTTNTQAGVQVTVTGLSPIALAWTEAPEYPTVAAAYGIGVLDTTNGTVRASVKRAAAGTTVTLTVSPDAGYGLETLTVTTSQGKQVALTEAGAGTYTFRMPASAVTISGTFAQVAAETPEEAPGFQDVDENAYYAEAVAWAVANGITNGTSDTSFEPDGSCTRAQVVTFLWRYAGKPEPTTSESPFTDVEEGSYYYKAVLWAYENGITKGTSDTTFSPDDTCTRAQVVTFLWRYEQEPEAAQAETFTDVAADAYYAKAVAWAVAHGITKGTGDGRFSPDETCVRSQVVTFLYRDSTEG
jgi:uncharacterized repeat protein (TIGR02543 family)